TRVVEVGHGRIESYPGNYEDFLRKKGQEGDASHSSLRVEHHEAKTSAQSVDKQERIQSHQERKQVRRAEQKRQRELQDVEGFIEEQEANLAELERTMADPDIYGDRTRWQDASRRFEKLQEEISGLYERWEKLQIGEAQ
ncbi:MAG TPA: ABC transporter ATP-binding protein, partial [Desulfuromonadales bacterium]|nr:ABC transporter ATP-binding protein [Desulfuromonadales bacterium]